MIKDVISSGPFVQVTGGGSYTPYVNMSNSSAGLVRFNGNSQNLEVYDGVNWMAMSSSVASVGLTIDAQGILVWAKQKMEEEQRLRALMDRHPGLRDAHDTFEIMRMLVTQEEKGAQ